MNQAIAEGIDLTIKPSPVETPDIPRHTRHTAHQLPKPPVSNFNADAPITDEQVAKFVRNEEHHTKDDQVATRHVKYYGEKKTISRQYGRDLAAVLKMKFVDCLTVPMIQKTTGLSAYMINEMCKPFAVMLDNPDRVKQFKANEPHLLDGVRMLMVQGMVDQLTDAKRRKTIDLSRLTYGYGVLYDKARLERGESTANVMTLSDLVRAAHATPVMEAEVVEE
jgi:hypothetical protein